MDDSMEQNFIIKIENLCINVGKKEILKNINLEIKKGEIFGILGPNGSGKSTLLSVIASILKPNSGQVIINKNTKIGFVPQEIALYPTLSAYDNLKFWAGIYKLTDQKDKIKNILSFLKLEDVSHKQICKFSIGMQRRLNIGVALIHNPDVIIMDEPTVGIDISSKQIILDKIINLKMSGKTFIYTTHNSDEPEKIFDRVGVIRNGSIMFTGSLKEVMKKCNVEIVENLMS